MGSFRGLVLLLTFVVPTLFVVFCGGGGTYSEHRFPALSSTDVVNQCLESGGGIEGLGAICPFSGP